MHLHFRLSMSDCCRTGLYQSFYCSVVLLKPGLVLNVNAKDNHRAALFEPINLTTKLFKERLTNCPAFVGNVILLENTHHCVNQLVQQQTRLSKPLR